MVSRRHLAVIVGLLALATAAVGGVSIRRPTPIVVRGGGVPSDLPDPPAQPSGLSAALDGADIVLDWGDVAGAAEYRVYRGFGGGTEVVEIVATSSWTDTTTVSGAPHTYRVAAVDGAGQVSDLSAEVGAWPTTVKTYRTPFYYLGQWRDYADTAPLSQAEIDSMAHFDAVGFMPHFYEGAHERGYEDVLQRVRTAAAALDGHEVIGLTYFFGNAARFNWAPGPTGLTHPEWGYQAPYPEAYDRSINPHTRIWDWCVANDAFLHDTSGQPMINLAYPVYNFDYGNLALADTLAAYTVEAYANGPTDGEYAGFLYDFVNADVQSWTADLNTVDIDRDGLAYNSSTGERNQEIALYRAWHVRCLQAIRREFGERGLANRLIVVNGNGAQNLTEIAELVDGFMQERWNDYENGSPGWSSSRYPTSASYVAAWENVLANYCDPARYPKSQVRPYPFLFHMYVDSDAPWCSLAPALAVNGWAHGNNPTLNAGCGTSDSCYSKGANGASRMSLPPVRLDPGAVGEYSIRPSASYPGQGDTLVVPAANYTMRMALRPTGTIKGPWPHIIIAANGDTLRRGGGWPRQPYAPPPPVAAFSGTPLSGYASLAVTFTDASSNSPTIWSWDFGDGGTSSAQNPTHSYTAPGVYDVELVAGNAGGSDGEVKSAYVTVSALPPAPVANFSGSPLSGDAPLAVTFTDASTNTPTSWAWDFGDGGTSSAQNPSHNFTTPGVYDIELVAGNAGGSDGEVKANYVTVTEAPPTGAPAIATFSGTDDVIEDHVLYTVTGIDFGAVASPQLVVFDDLESGSQSAVWDDEGANNVPVITATSDLRRHVGSTKHGRHQFTGDRSISDSYATYRDGLASRTFFGGYWFRLADNWQWGAGGVSGDGQVGSSLANVKFVRLSTAGSVDDWTIAVHPYSGSGIWATAVSATCNSSVTSESGYCCGEWSGWDDSTWHHVQFEWVDSSTAGAADARFKVWVDGQVIESATNFIGMKCAAGGYKRIFGLGFYDSWWDSSSDPNQSTPYNFYIDDIYYDTQLARVEIGDASTYAACTHREVQLAVTWSDTEITFDSRMGSFALGTLYLYIVDGSGTPSAGYPVYLE